MLSFLFMMRNCTHYYEYLGGIMSECTIVVNFKRNKHMQAIGGYGVEPYHKRYRLDATIEKDGVKVGALQWAPHAYPKPVYYGDKLRYRLGHAWCVFTDALEECRGPIMDWVCEYEPEGDTRRLEFKITYEYTVEVRLSREELLVNRSTDIPF